MIGGARGNASEAPPRHANVGGFFMDKFEVTHTMFAQAQLQDPSHWQGNPKEPLGRLRWRNATSNCNERSLLECFEPRCNEKTTNPECAFAANAYRLPTELEWEFAARAGGDGAADFGLPVRPRLHPWFAEYSDEQTHAASEKESNRWGVIGPYGDVAEWCEDVYSPTDYNESAAGNPREPPNPGPGVKRVLLGGSWPSPAETCCVTFRKGRASASADACLPAGYRGFRHVRRIPAAELQAPRPKAR